MIGYIIIYHFHKNFCQSIRIFNYDDAFFNRNWAGAYRGRWVGPGLLTGYIAGFWIVWAEVGLLQKQERRGVGEGFARGRSDA